MKKLVSVLVLCIVGQLPFSRAFATLVTIEPDDFAAGAYISYATPGVILYAVSTTYAYTNSDGVAQYAPVLGPVFSHQVRADCTAPYDAPCSATGDQVFGFEPGSEASSNGTLWGDLSRGGCGTGCGYIIGNLIKHVLRLDFASPIDYLDVLGYFSGGDPTGVLSNGSGADAQCINALLDEGLASCAQRYGDRYTGLPDPRYGWGRVSISSASADITTVYIGGFLNLHQIDEIRYHTVPEPSLLGLFGLGLASIGMSRCTRRRRCREGDGARQGKSGY